MHVFQVGAGSGGMAVLDLVARDPRVTRVTLVEPDVYKPHNVYRHLFPPSAVGRLKAELAAEWVRAVRPDLAIEAIVADLTDPARHEVDMVFQFEHVDLDHGEHKWDRKPLDLRDLKASFGRWQEGLADVGWNSLYWNNHDQPRAVSRFGSDAPEHRVASAKLLGTVLHLHRGTPYVYQGEELGMTNMPFVGPGDFQDVESVNYYRTAVEAGRPVAPISWRSDGKAHWIRADARDDRGRLLLIGNPIYVVAE